MKNGHVKRRSVTSGSMAWLRHYKVGKVRTLTAKKKLLEVKLTKAMLVEVVRSTEFTSADIANRC